MISSTYHYGLDGPLASGDARIIDVALRSGYDSPDAFAKAFRKLFGCTPTEARWPGARLRSYPPIACSVTLKGARSMDYRLETKPAFSLTGLPLRTTSRDDQSFREIPDLWQRCLGDGSFDRLRALVPAGSAIGVAGVCAEFDMSSGEFSYVIAVETPADRAGLPRCGRARRYLGHLRGARPAARLDPGRDAAYLQRVVPFFGLGARRRAGTGDLLAGR